MKDILLVFIGGGLGSAIRLLLNKIVPGDAFPYSTLTVNYYYFLVVGICGGLTTFSAFSLENLNLLKSNDIAQSILYVIISVSFCILLAYIGFILMNKILNY